MRGGELHYCHYITAPNHREHCSGNFIFGIRTYISHCNRGIDISTVYINNKCVY